MSRLVLHCIPLVLAASLAACGNKGNLVKPTPSTLPPPTPTDPSATPGEPTTSDTKPKPAQDSGGH